MGDESADSGLNRRKLLRAGGTLAAFASFGGCLSNGGSGGGSSGGDSTGEGSSGTDTGETRSNGEALVTNERVGRGDTGIEYWTSSFYSPIEAQSDQPAAAPAIKKQGRAWAEEHPDYRIELTYQNDSDQWQKNLLTRASRGSPPPGSTLDSFWIPDNYEYLQALNDEVADIDDFFPFVQETAMRDGDLLAAWKYTDCRCLYYDEEILKEHGNGEPPRTWEDVIDVGKGITKDEDMAGFLYRTSTFDTLPFFWGQGASLVDKSGEPVLGKSKNREAAINVFSFLERTVKSGVTPQRAANIGEYERLAREARNGETAMFIGGNWQVSKDFKNEMEGDAWKRWKVAEIPMREPDQQATGVGGWAEGAYLGGDDGKAKALRDYVAKFVEPEAMGRYCEAASLLPTRESLYENEDLFASDVFPYQDQFRQFLENGHARPAFPIYSTIDSEWENAIGSVLTGQQSPEKAVGTIIENVNEEYGS